MHKKILQILIFIIPLFYVFHYVISYSGKLVNNAEKVKNNLVINELLADNIGGLKDENGNYSDWIELYNPTDENVNLEGFAIGNQRNINKAFKLPPTDIPANGYLVIFADGQDYIDDNIHLNFLLNKSGESVYLFDPNGEVIDEMTYPSLEVNISYGRSFNNMNEEGIFTFATPGSLNTSSFIKQREIKDIGTVLFSMSGGNYDEEFYLELSSVVPNAIILFTLDGSEPTPENAEVYTEPIRITSTESIPNKYVTQRCIPDTDANQDFHNYLYTYGVNNVKKGTVIRARLYLNGILSEKIETETYYINTDYSLPVVSIVTDPDDLFGNEEGSYVLGSAYYAASRLNIGVETLGNYYIDKKIDAHIEIWDVNGEKIIDDDIELKQGGAYSRMYSIQKSFNINLLNSKISFKSESSSNEYSYSDFALKGTGGGEVFPSCYQKHFLNNFLEPVDIGTKIEEFCVLFIDGEYWGIYSIVEPKNEEYFKEHYQVDSIEYYESGVETSSSEFLDEMDSLAKWINETDFTQNDNYEILKEKIDIDNFCTFLATDVLVGNYDCMIGFDHNLIVWKSDEINEENEYCDGRLRWIPIDMDSTLFSTGSSAAVLDTLINQEVEKVKGNRISIILFQQLWKRIDFRIMLSQKIYEIGDVYFNVNRIEEKYDEHYQLLSREIDENIARLEMGVNGTVSSVLSLLGIEIDLRENLTRAEWEGSMATLKGNLLTQFDAVKEEIRKYGAYELSDVYAEVKADSTYEGYSLFASGFSGVANDGNENYVWTTGNSSVFHVLLNEDYKEMTGIRMAINEIPITENQRCDVYVNGEYLTETVLGLGTVNIDIPARYFVNRYAEIELMWKDAKSPKELLIGEDETLLACRIYSVQFFDLQDVLINVEKNISLKGEELEKAIINGSVISVTDETGEYIWSVGNYTEWEFLIVAKTKIRVYCSGITTEQRVKVIINDRYVSTVVADDVFEFDILEGDSVNDIVKIRFEYLDAASPKELGINEQETIFAIRIYKMEFEIE